MGAMRKSTHSREHNHLRAVLREIRTDAGLSQRALAQKLRLPHTWVAKVESGERRLDLVEFGWFCVACGISPVEAGARVFAPARPNSTPPGGTRVAKSNPVSRRGGAS